MYQIIYLVVYFIGIVTEIIYDIRLLVAVTGITFMIYKGIKSRTKEEYRNCFKVLVASIILMPGLLNKAMLAMTILVTFDFAVVYGLLLVIQKADRLIRTRL